MATQPTNLPVPSESPRDLKFNAGKIDEFVTSLVNTYVDRFGNEHYTIEGLRWLAQQAIAQYGWIPVGTFQAGATLTLPNQILKDTTDGEYYRWDGSFLPSGKIVPNGSTPGSTGGVGVGAWLSVGDSTLRALLASELGAQNIGNGESTVNEFLYHTPEEFYSGNMDSALSASLSATASDGRTTWVKGNKTLASSHTIPTGVNVLNDGTITSSETGNMPVLMMGDNTRVSGGNIVSTGRSQALRAEGKLRLSIESVSAKSTFVTYNGLPAYAFDFYDSTDLSIQGVYGEAYTGGIALTRTNRTQISGATFRGMVYHPSLDAGGYGVLLQGAKNTIITDLFFKAGTDGYGRHGIYVSRTGVSFCSNTVINGAVFDYTEQPATTPPPGAINIRSTDRLVIASTIIDGSRLTGTTENGNISALVVSGNIINSFKYGTSIAYGITLGDDTGGNRVRNCIVSNNIVSIGLKDGAPSEFLYAIVIAGQDNVYSGNYTRIPDQGQPYLVRQNATNILIEGAMDSGPLQGQGLPFVLFDGTASNISIKGCKTNRPWFRPGNLSGVTDLTVDWARSCAVALSTGTPSYEDSNELISSTTVGTANVVVTFNSHVTTAALAAAIVTTRKTSNMSVPVIIARSGKTLTIEFYSLANGTLINPSTTNCAATITLLS
ncbi:tail fiber/spike domain-containing protein [Huaxiibacter chinensis]